MRFLPLPALAAVLALGAALPARAMEWGGYAGLLYSREDAWATGYPRQGTPHLDLNLGLSVDGYVYTPGAFNWSAAGDYRRTSDGDNTSKNVQDFIQYRARATAFGDPRTPLSFSVHAMRSTEQSSPSASNPSWCRAPATA